ncbi:MAG: hypothetical protein JWO90_2757 [Solirubrobacterales bacterium]|nr:hypothetical protein [Solirubrobacterales bacterium]
MRSALVAVLAAALLAPVSAGAQSAPFAPLPQAPQPQPETVVVAPGSSGDEGISSFQQALLIAAGVLFVVGIGVLIARDARRNAPVDPRPPRPYETEALEGAGERKKRDARTTQKQKAAAKRARDARRRNRPVRK